MSTFCGVSGHMDTTQSMAAASTKERTRYATAHHRLKPVKLPRIKNPGYYHDGGGLYLDVRSGRSGTTRVWVYRYTLHGKARTMGLGPLHTISLADARQKARDA